ncbi:MAG: type IV pilin protein, partial [Chthoniobacterales bacterium]
MLKPIPPSGLPTTNKPPRWSERQAQKVRAFTAEKQTKQHRGEKAATTEPVPMNRRKQRTRGFTLIEIMVVVAIIALLAAV